MSRQRWLIGVAGITFLAVGACDSNVSSVGKDTKAGPGDKAIAESGPSTGSLFQKIDVKATASGLALAPIQRDVILVPECKLTVIDKQDVPSERDGTLAFIGTELKEGEEAAPADVFLMPANGRIIPIINGPMPAVINLAGGSVFSFNPASSAQPVAPAGSAVTPTPEMRKFRIIKVGDKVAAGQLLARLDNSLPWMDMVVKNTKVRQAELDYTVSQKTRDEAKVRHETTQKIRSRGGNMAAPDEETRGSQLTHEKFISETLSKEQAIESAKQELSMSRTVVQKHDIRATISGEIKRIYKHKGEAVKALEPVFEIHNHDKLRVEGRIDAKYVPFLRPRMKVTIEAPKTEGPVSTVSRHLDEVTGICFLRDNQGKDWLATGSLDTTVLVWDVSKKVERGLLRHPTPVRCLAATPPGAPVTYLLSGGADGIARLWNIDKLSDKPEHAIKSEHRGAISCVAFSPNGKWFVTGGEDYQLRLWETATAQLKYKFPTGHRNGVTCVAFTPNAQVVSAGKDNTLRLWTLGPDAASLYKTLDRRGGAVTHLGVSPDGNRVLFDQGSTLRILSLPDFGNESVLDCPDQAHNFSSFAQFSPDGKLILTAGDSDGRMQLWKAPTSGSRISEIRQLIPSSATQESCAAFTLDGKYLVTGTKKGHIQLWPVPTAAEVDNQLTAVVTWIEPAVDSSSNKIRIWAELPNRDGRLLPGETVTMAISLEK